jgi:hypothetical protein
MIAFVFSAQAAVVDPSIELLLHFSETSGHTFADASGHGNDGSCSGSACPTMALRGAFGPGIRFDGSDVINVPVDVSETSYTSSVWFQTTQQSIGIFSVVDIGSGGHDRHIYLSGGAVCVRTWSDETICGGANAANGMWHHVAHVFGGGTGGQHVYLDGVQVAAGAKAQSDFNWQTSIQVGFSADATTQSFNGMLDEIAVFNRDLSPQEIKNLYDLGAFRQNTAIDPAGRFVVYAGRPKGCLNDRPVLQPLANGKPAGNAVLLVSCSALPEDTLAYDLLRDGSTDQYWFSFGGNQNTDARYIMKIDAAGKVIQPVVAAALASSAKYKAGATALTDAGSYVRMWTPAGAGYLYSVLIAKSNLKALNLKKVLLAPSGITNVQSSQDPSRPFLAFQVPKFTLKAFGFMTTGAPDGSSWRLSPRTDAGHFVGGLAADGLMALSDVRLKGDKLYAQPLNANGRPSVVPAVVAGAPVIGSADVSNPVGPVRFLVFGTPAGFYIARIDAVTGVRVSRPVLL